MERFLTAREESDLKGLEVELYYNLIAVCYKGSIETVRAQILQAHICNIHR